MPPQETIYSITAILYAIQDTICYGMGALIGILVGLRIGKRSISLGYCMFLLCVLATGFIDRSQMELIYILRKVGWWQEIVSYEYHYYVWRITWRIAPLVALLVVGLLACRAIRRL